MTAALSAAALLVVAAAIGAAAVVLARTRSLRQALPVLLEFLTAAGLLRLTAAPTWTSLAVTVAVIVLRRLVSPGVRTAGSRRRGALPRLRSGAGPGQRPASRPRAVRLSRLE